MTSGASDVSYAGHSALGSEDLTVTQGDALG